MPDLLTSSINPSLTVGEGMSAAVSSGCQHTIGAVSHMISLMRAAHFRDVKHDI